MFWSKKKSGNTQTDISAQPQKQINYEEKYRKLKKKYNKLYASIGMVKESINALLEEQNVASFLLFSIAIKCGGKLELTPYDIDVAKKMEAEHTLDFVDNNNVFTYAIKRKE